jgi:hypothetical protein
MKKRVMLGVLAVCVTVFGMAFAVDMNGPQGPGGGGVLADLGTNPPIDPPCTCKELSITTVPQIAEVCEKCCLSGVVKWVLTPGTDSYTVKVFIIPGTLAQVGKTSCEDAMSSECEWNYSPCSSGQENFYIKGVNAGVGHIKAVLYKNGVECLQQMKPLTVVRVDSVTPAWTAVSTNVEVTFTATTTPAHHGDNVYWSGGGVPATGHGETFTTKWPNVGCKTVVAKCDGGCNQKEAQVAVVNLDLDIDSDHTSDFGGPQGDAFEDSIEWKLPGPHPHEAHKYVVVNDYYRESEQGKPGYADFAMAVPEGPVPSEIIIPLSLKCECPTDCGLDFSQATIKFEYSSSDPAGVTTSSDRGETIWPIPSGNLRLWKKQGSRNPAHFTGTGSAGDYLAANQEIPAPSLGFPGSMPLYLEGINPSASLGADTIKATVKIPAAAGGIYSFEDLIRCTAIKVDVDLDTDNNNGYEAPDRNLKEDHYEDMPGSMNRPGKILAVNDNDDDQDGIPDFADGYNRYGNVSADDINTSEKLVPVVFEIPIPIDLARAKVKLTYDASDPMGVVTNAQGVYQLPGGSLRIWTKKGNVARKGTSILDSSNPGDYIPAGECTAEEFGFTSGTRTLTNYVEAVRASTALADKRILFEVDPDERTPPNFIAADAVKLTVLKVDIAMDGNRDDSIDFDNPADSRYLFWVNDDVDVISGGEEDDANTGTPDCNDSAGAITCKRDLEDFTRLHIKVDDTMANLPGITYFMKFETVTSGSPSVNIFEAVGESSTYLSDTSVAAQQIQKTKLITVGTTEVQLPSQYIKMGNQRSPFILEGKTAGKGVLTIIVKKDGNEVCKKAVTLDLRPITAFYEKYIVATSTGDNVNTTSGGNVNSTTYTPETDEYVLHVHGWNMADWEKDRWTETVFKRLWWQRYKGHVGGFQWPTYTGSLTYDASEIRAWRSGQALNNRIASLNASYPGQVRVIAHSMGNVVMGEALRLFSTSVVHTYIAAQAAIPAHCYDNTIAGYWTGFSTPNIYAQYSSGLPPDAPYLAANSSHAGAMVQYFNVQDYALGWWENNNQMKPDLNYGYTDGDNDDDSYLPYLGDRFYYDSPLPFDERTLTIPGDRFEIFARVAESRSRALGRESSVNGFGTARNLQNWGYNAAHYSHSREFRSNVADEDLFWTAVRSDCQLRQ